MENARKAEGLVSLPAFRFHADAYALTWPALGQAAPRPPALTDEGQQFHPTTTKGVSNLTNSPSQSVPV